MGPRGSGIGLRYRFSGALFFLLLGWVFLFLFLTEVKGEMPVLVPVLVLIKGNDCNLLN